MTMLKRLGRLFVIKTRTEAWLVTYAIAVGAVERGQHYMQQYPGFGGWLLALACTGVVFIAGARLLDSVKKTCSCRRRRAIRGGNAQARRRRPQPAPASAARSSRRSAVVQPDGLRRPHLAAKRKCAGREPRAFACNRIAEAVRRR